MIKVSFQSRNAEGVSGQEVVKRHLEQRGNEVVDVSLDKAYQKIDIDFIVRKDGIETTLEVKSDKQLFTTGNILFEVGCQREDYYVAGWLKYCQARYVAVYDSRTAHGIIIDFQKIKPLLEVDGVKKVFYDYEDDKETTVILYAVETARKNNIIVHEWYEQI